MNKKPLYVSILEYSREFMEVACWWFCWWPNFPVFHGGFHPLSDGVGGGVWLEQLLGRDSTPNLSCIHGSNVSKFHGKSWKPMVFKNFETQHQPRIYCFAAFATRCHKNPWLFSPQLRTHRSCRSFITGSEVRDLQKTWPAGRKNSQQRCGQAPQSHRLRSIWAAISWCVWMILDDFGWFWMILNDFGWFWMILDDFGWFWMILDDFGWFWMCLDVFGCVWMYDDFGWFWMCLDVFGCVWMILDDFGWIWMILDDFGCVWMCLDVWWFWMILDVDVSSKIIQKWVSQCQLQWLPTWRHWWPLVPCTACSDRPNRLEGFHQSWAENSVETDLKKPVWDLTGSQKWGGHNMT